MVVTERVSWSGNGALTLATLLSWALVVVFGPLICRGKGYPRLWTRFQITLTSDYVADFGLVPFSELGE